MHPAAHQSDRGTHWKLPAPGQMQKSCCMVPCTKLCGNLRNALSACVSKSCMCHKTVPDVLCIWCCVALTQQAVPPVVQMMVLLGSALHADTVRAPKLQALEGWLALVRALTKHAPDQLCSMLNQV